MCDCAEEQERRAALARKRQQDGTDASSQGASPGGSRGLTWYSILGGTFLLALTAFAIKIGTDEGGWVHTFFIYMGWEKEEPLTACPVKIDDSKRRWPPEENKE